MGLHWCKPDVNSLEFVAEDYLKFLVPFGRFFIQALLHCWQSFKFLSFWSAYRMLLNWQVYILCARRNFSILWKRHFQFIVFMGIQHTQFLTTNELEILCVNAFQVLHGLVSFTSGNIGFHSRLNIECVFYMHGQSFWAKFLGLHWVYIDVNQM